MKTILAQLIWLFFDLMFFISMAALFNDMPNMWQDVMMYTYASLFLIVVWLFRVVLILRSFFKSAQHKKPLFFASGILSLTLNVLTFFCLCFILVVSIGVLGVTTNPPY
ncbi:hypothetical protein [Lewinella sp. 4G2]|uniref:hypothetical protein n=1 Tax=Lewinella sp. 4G2 TaxID=1803372 RepID=UPI0007B4EF48|nr:hypothetical protein [Lewinella sp. 4G2]OAV42916.1 hypothetical protein A3850_016970 [Lewinella sp. 4G2]